MTPETSTGVWHRLETLFHTAAELEPEERASFLDEACAGDMDLRHRLENLLAAADKTFGFLRDPVARIAHDALAGDACEGARIGEYLLIRALGSGGMGRVYLAKRADGQFEQRVAIKLMHTGFALSHGLSSRFRVERQILANLEHLNIARLLGGGITKDGLPYIVMEYIDGVPIVDYCRVNKISIEQKLSLLRQVCDALDYAHRNLVVHRDVKPGNILVTVDGTPKLLDFGIAKLLGPDMDQAREGTVATEQFLTPDYASPEQILRQPITTATDVYALGVLLYEVICDSRPFAGKAKDAIELTRLICSEAPEPPSVVASRSRQIPRGEIRKIKGDLDNIVLMAMRKEPGRRYASVAQFSSDIDASLQHRPVLAAPDSWRYRMSKFISRHKLGVSMAAVLIITLAAFSVGMGVLAKRAMRAQLRSDQEANFLSSMFQAATPEEAQGRTITARDLLDRGARRVDRDLASQPEVRAAMLDNIATAYRSVGLFDQAQSLMQRSYDLKKKVYGPSAIPTIATLDGVAELYRDQGKWPQAESSLRAVLAARQKVLAPTDPVLVDSMGELGECLYWEDKMQEAEAVLRKGLVLDRKLGTTHGGADVRNYLALVVERHSGFDEAAQLLTEAAEIDRKMNGPESPSYARTLHNLASALIDTGDLTGAESKLRETVALRRKILGNDHPELALSLNNLAFVLLEEGEPMAAEPFVKETLRIWTKEYGALHYRTALAYVKLGTVNEQEGNYGAAEAHYRAALEMTRKVKAPSWMSAGVLENMSRLELDRHSYPAAQAYAEQALNIRTQRGGDDPELASSFTDIGLAQELSVHDTQAELSFRKALAIREAKLPAKHPAVMAAKIRLGEVLTAQGKLREAELLLRDADAVAHNPPVPLLPWQIAEADSALGACLAALGHSSEARILLDRSQAGLKSHPRAAIREMALARMRRQ